MAATNSTILGKIWLNGTNDYQQRVPDPTQASVSKTFDCLFSPMNGSLYNQFIDGFVNLIGQQRINQSIWENPLQPFKGPRLMYGSTIQEAAPKWIRAHTYNDSATDLLKMERPEFAVWYHSMNRQDKYPISIVRAEVQQAFRDEYGLNALVNSIMATPLNSDNYDEFQLMMNTLAEYERTWGFYKHHADAAPHDDASGRDFLTALRTYADLLRFPSQLYNAAAVDVPVFAKPDELVLLIDAHTSASVDVNTLASIFNLDLADIKYRKIVVPEIPIAGAFALLTTSSFFVCNDIVYENGSFYDPNTMSTKYILQHWEVVSASPFVPAILFTTEAATSVTTVTQNVTGITIKADPAEVEPGGTVQLSVELAGTIEPEDAAADNGVTVAPDAATWSIVCKGVDGEAKGLTSRTYVDRLGVLHAQALGLAAGDVLTVTGAATYGKAGEFTATVDVKVK